MTSSIVVPARFNGPLASGNGGYSCGAIASAVDGPTEVDLRSPVPLDTPLEIARDDTGAIRAMHGDVVVAEARPVDELTLEVPAPVGVDEARGAARGYRGLTTGGFSQCFVCSRTRDDTLGVHAGPVPGRDLVATPWTPPPWSADEDGRVRPEIVWAVLDCPTFFASYLERDPLPTAFLVRQQARLDGTVMAREEHVVIAWPLEVSGRKTVSGCALLSEGGDALAIARVLHVEPRPA